MKYCWSAVMFVLIALFSSCAGVKFGNSDVNNPIPDGMKERSLYPAGVSVYEFQDLVGNVLIVKTGINPRRAGIVLPAGYVASVIPITDPENYYHSRIQKGAETNGSYLTFAANLSADDLKEITVIDVARAGVALTETSWASIIDKCKTWVSANPKKEGETRLWIKAVVVSRQTLQSYNQINADASGQIGNVVGVKGKVYNNNKEENKSAIIAFEAFDIDSMIENAAKKADVKGFMPAYTSILNLSVYKNQISGTIEKGEN